MSLQTPDSLDASHAADLQSWVASANAPDTDFPIQNLPFGLFRELGAPDTRSDFRPGVAIGDQIVDLAAASAAGLLPADCAGALAACVRERALNPMMGAGPAVRSGLRHALSEGLTLGSPAQAALSACLLPMAAAELAVPARIGDYTDFYTGIHHATTVGKLFRPDNPLLPNYHWVPIGYHGRASSVVVSGQALRHPHGQLKGPNDAAPRLGLSQRLDYELELGAFIGGGNALGSTISMHEAENHLFGLVLLNDWSARDIQAWEYQPLGPFLAKNFGTTVSPWIVTPEALAPFRRPFTRPAGDPAPLPYLDSTVNRHWGQFDIQLEVWLQTASMREAGLPHERLMQSNASDAYWTIAQLITHHTVNGCNLASGDLLGTGTISGPKPEQGGSLMELSQGGKQPISLSNGETRTFLQDGDSVTLRAHCVAPGARRIGFGDCEGQILPVVTQPQPANNAT